MHCTCVVQAWAKTLYETRQYLVSPLASGQQCFLYLIPYRSKAEIRFLGFQPGPNALQESGALQNRIKLVLDLDETLVNSHEDAGLQVCMEQRTN